MISSVIIAKNEQDNIGTCIEKLKWCEEIIVIDDYSTDKTAQIARERGATVIKNHLNGDFSSQRNFALDKVNEKWILYVDADEHVSYELRQEILKKINDISYKAFSVQRVDYFFGKKLKFGDSGNTRLTRLVRKGTGKWVGKVHETWISEGKVGELENPLKHYPHPSIVSFLRHINLYSTLRAKELYDLKKNVSALEIVAYPIGKFIYNWIIKLGFLDGTRGIIHALMMSFYTFLVRSKLFLLWKNISGTISE
jgi:glycosyltransferase involved in cell wall biosynthesis